MRCVVIHFWNTYTTLFHCCREHNFSCYQFGRCLIAFHDAVVWTSPALLSVCFVHLLFPHLQAVFCHIMLWDFLVLILCVFERDPCIAFWVEIPIYICIKCFLETVLLCLCNSGAFSSKIKVFTFAVLPDRVPPLVCLNFTQGATFLYQLIIFVHLSHVRIAVVDKFCLSDIQLFRAAHWLWLYREQNRFFLHDELTTGTKSCSLYCIERVSPSPTHFAQI